MTGAAVRSEGVKGTEKLNSSFTAFLSVDLVYTLFRGELNFFPLSPFLSLSYKAQRECVKGLDESLSSISRLDASKLTTIAFFSLFLLLSRV